MQSTSARPALDHPESELLAALRRYWGYDSFRPMQERIVRSLLGGQDACVVMPTGGGKSLCYQLPAALLADRTVVVVSPLIALMQDQVAQLRQMGIPAALLNSTLAADEQSEILREAIAGRYRLLYLSPERLARADTIEWLQRVPVSLFAIDEAHCISEWGHEFRPEYRQLSSLRRHFPDRPIAAFTASATRQVRHDIIEQLALREPHKYIASFHRANLRYVVKECSAQMQSHLLARALQNYSGSNVIIYAPTIKRVEETVDFLAAEGIAAIGYHGKMDNAARRRNQEKWMSDEVPVLVGTVAFGLGINKAAVRAVIHLSLPKSIEQYYQEAGRAGRDGLPADCVMLWQKRDVGLLAHFMEQLTDPQERERGWQRYHIIRNFVESTGCRHRQICLHFGETPKWATCGACDVCGCEIPWLSAPAPAPKSKRRGKSSKSSAVAPAGSFAAAASITFTRGPRPGRQDDLPVSAAADDGARGSGWWGSAGKRKGSGASARNTAGIDPELREYMREWRRVVSKRMNIAAFIIMHDTSLDHLCQLQPRSLADMRKVSGFGERKTEMYGPAILEALQRFRNGARIVAEPFDD
ncbi:MAG TPA: ATP-dependent DNA helicase RecQ [Candidatus Acidoferrales bacterium]|jgi:ATP-dependent DNA helicase RecQ|nr:ATP-dependent DNA helicase RecQ [Candidatus Acidoferrales bacterium]